MKIKHILFYALAVCLLTAGISCSKVLDRKPQDSISDLNYWQTADELKLFCNNFYPELYVPDQFADDQSDNCVPNSPNSWLYGLTTVPSSGGGWDYTNWAYIRNANYFLTHYQTATGSAEEIDEYLGEIHFFRAYEYFNKMKDFGDVPWINKDLNVNDSSFLYAPRTDRSIITDSIIADLKIAVEKLPTSDQVELGRLHKYAAEQMLARVCLYEGTWMKYRGQSGWESYLQQATDAAKDIMDNGGSSARVVLQRALQAKTTFVAVSSFSPNLPKENTLRLNYSNMPVEKITTGGNDSRDHEGLSKRWTTIQDSSGSRKVTATVGAIHGARLSAGALPFYKL